MARKTQIISLFLTVFLAAPAFSQTRWTRVHSENLEMYSSAGETRSKDTIRLLEQVRAFFLESTGVKGDRLGQATIVGFRLEDDYAKYRPAAGPVAFSVLGADRDYLVVNAGEASYIDAAAGAYATLMIHQAGLHLPAWLDQALPEFYSSFVQKTGPVTAGDISPARRKALSASGWVALDTILGAPAGTSPSAPESFALLHMLVLGPDYSPKFKELIAALERPGSPQSALEKVYGKNIPSIEADLKSYIVSDHFVGSPVATSQNLSIAMAEPASALDVNLALAGISNRPGRESDAAAWFERLSKENPSRPEVWTGLGYLALRQGRLDEANQYFQKAASLGGPDAKVTLARLLDRASYETQAAAPELARTRITLGSASAAPAPVPVAKEKEIALEKSSDKARDDKARDDKARDDKAKEKEEAAAREAAKQEQRAKEIGEAREKAQAAEREKAEAKAKSKEQMLANIKLAEEARAQEAEAQKARVRQEAQERAKAADEKAKAKADLEANIKAAQEAREREQAEAREKAAAELREKAEAKAKQQADAKAAQEARAREAQEAKEKGLADAREKAEEKARVKASAEADAKAAQEAKVKQAQEAHEKALADARAQAEEKARQKAAVEENLRLAREALEKQAAQAKELAAAAAREKAEAKNREKAENREKADSKSKSVESAPLTAKVEPPVKEPVQESGLQGSLQASSSQPSSSQPASSQPAPQAEPAKPFPAMTAGTFVELGCGEQIKVVLQTVQGRKNFLIKDPANVIVSGPKGGTVDLECGPQKPVNVRVQYGPTDSASLDGAVQALYFE
jgi:hypothetical protein